MIYELRRFHIYPNHHIAILEFKEALKKFSKNYGPVAHKLSNLTITCQGIELRFRGKHDFESFIRGRMLDKVVSYTTLTKEEEMHVRISLLRSKVLKPFTYSWEEDKDDY